MKITFTEEIESHRAWRGCSGCSNCGELKYEVHHQIDPDIYNSWWVTCPNCGHEGRHRNARDDALAWWRSEE